MQAGELEESTDEYAVTIAASLAGKYLEQNLPVGLIAYGDKRYFLPAETGVVQFDRIMEYLAMSKAEGTTALESALPREEEIWGYHSSLIIITPSNRPDWTTAVKELIKRRVRIAVVLVDGQSFGGLFETEAVIPHLYDAGVPPYLVRRGDDIPIALDHAYISSELRAAEELEDAEVRL